MSAQGAHAYDKDALNHLFVVHGGPGFDSHYLKDDFLFLNQLGSVHFYDQLSCSDNLCASGHPTPEDLVAQLKTEITTHTPKGKKFGIVAHSWGAYLVYELLKDPLFRPEVVIFVTPMPLTREKLNASLVTLQSRVAKEDFVFLYPASDTAGCISSTEKIFQYYHYDNRPHPFKSKACNSYILGYIFADIGNYDQTEVLPLLPAKTLWLTSEADIFKTEPKLNWTSIERAGHFPFAENPTDFQAAIRKFLSED